ncbi:DUF6503 family protein [Maribacter luteus]|uniref:Deoxyribose-phosphate aldolase n=1 Tax=Maribacter luteus TaxID=2594478 RepID=A0A6I2MTQ2_9FLAO|nr:DUF6503 family protein [Maribacter luteus]MRX65995.1 deoxyribose-phosphate aldolase [Maribacter luteus]
MEKTKSILVVVILAVFFSCKEKTPARLTAQQIVDKSIDTCGGEKYRTSNVSFKFRGKEYIKENVEGQKVLKRLFKNDSVDILDSKGPKGFKRYINGDLVNVPDSLANIYSNSINSVHYFAYLPYGLNDPAVNKEFLGEMAIKGKDYYKVKVTFDQENGGDDFDDVYIYWFNKETFKPEYLAYEFHVNGGGLRFREAYNERYVNGIRFVDYNNYKSVSDSQSIYEIDSLFNKGELELLSKIELKDVVVSPGNYN